MTAKNLEELLQTVTSPVDLLRNQQTGPNVYPGVPAEYTNWRDEQQAWQNTCVLFNQSYHMADLAVEGPDAFKLLSTLSMNSFKNFEVNKAKQFVPCSPDGYVIGDVILFYLAENKFNLVGRAPALNWVTYHAQTGKYDVKVELDQRSALRTDGQAEVLPFPGAGPERDEGDREGPRQDAARTQVLQHDDADDRRQDGARAASRHGRPAGLGAVRSVGRRRGRARGAGQGRRRIRPAPGRRARLFLQHAGIGLDPVAAAGRLHRRDDEGLSRMAAGHGLRSHGVDRRQLLFARTSKTTTSRRGTWATAAS